MAPVMRLIAIVIVAAACSSGATAPPIDGVAEICIPDFCVDYPQSWKVVESGDRFVSFSYPEADGVVATVGRMNLEGIVVNAGGAWPVPPRDVIDHFWSLLDGGEAELAHVALAGDGALDSWGFIATGRLWHRLVPTSASRGFGIEVRGPNASWEAHAEVFRRNLVVVDSEL